MLKKLKEAKLDISLKQGFVLIALIFILSMLISRWIQYQSRTISDVMPLHHEEKVVSEEFGQDYFKLQKKNRELLCVKSSLILPARYTAEN